MPQIGPLIAAAASPVPVLTQRLLAGVTPDKFARLARPGGAVIQSNHPAFVLGHLSLYPARIMDLLGIPRGDTAFPASYDALFRFGQECQDDPDGRIYPAMDAMTKVFFDSYRVATAAVAAASDEKLLAPNPMEGRMRDMFPTLGAMFTFYLAGHTQNHLGQLSAWRRAMGLPPA